MGAIYYYYLGFPDEHNGLYVVVNLDSRLHCI